MTKRNIEERIQYGVRTARAVINWDTYRHYGFQFELGNAQAHLALAQHIQQFALAHDLPVGDTLDAFDLVKRQTTIIVGDPVPVGTMRELLRTNPRPPLV